MASDTDYILSDLEFEECVKCKGVGCSDCDNQGTIAVWECEL